MILIFKASDMLSNSYILQHFGLCLCLYFVGSYAGMPSLAALMEGRSAVCVVENDDDVSEVVGKMSALESPE